MPPDSVFETYYVTAYALTKGILKVQMRWAGRSGDSSHLVPHQSSSITGIYRLGVNAFRTLEGAVEATRKLLVKKEASLKRQLKKLENHEGVIEHALRNIKAAQ